MNRTIIVSGTAILLMGIVTSYQNNKNPSKIIEGTLLFMLLLSLLDATSPAMKKLASAFAILALLSTSIAELPGILQKIYPEREGNRPPGLGL